MIFVGNGALLKNAVEFAHHNGYPIDIVFCSSNDLLYFFNQKKISFAITDNINAEIPAFKTFATDKIVFSINNSSIFSKELLLTLDGFRFYNIHNGIIPKYRGRPEICVMFSILNGDKEYGVSLHEIDEGIDTGNCLDIVTFSISDDDTFERVMNKGLQHCKDIFCTNLNQIVNGRYIYLNVNKINSKLYSTKDLLQLEQYRTSPNLKRALHLGVFKLWYKQLDDFITKRNLR